ncbi:MAG: UDP-N-acetylmuramoylalanine--D-glutamate ligase [Candidatus Buchananbacteria bacterium RBG_13_39_9]|uniref:UDP-N-acetylmuramoylalanine--D-glutamate ligase n=1 Tax=Candidatus Buchananbacteria bacterium RBG_13_39_9 TaxID=1797531 RepID=A0A1G1XNP6_9BACT|nr:MAG: UDP-N-acetylmuramoylalanine--D-glutamate ligase [Candidatus Buchananbacteria bacterium RBG_13_39_9]
MKLSKSQENFPQFKNKKILVMGLGLHGGGTGAVKFFAQAGAKVAATDLKTRQQLKESVAQLKGLPVHYILGNHRETDFKNADLIIRNPAVADDSPYLKIAQKHKVPIDTDIGIFFRFCPAKKIIGITGTRGKSTTSTLIYELLKAKYQNVILAGNIRKSVLLELSGINKNSIVVLELSSWQLEGLVKHKKSPHIAIITTIQPDHLNRYKSMKEYIAAKKLIFKYQTKNDFLFLNKNDKIVKKFAGKTKAKVIFYGSKDAEKYKSRLTGKHNLTNIAAAIKVAKHFGVGDNAIKKILKNFKGLTGRIEFISEINGVKYVNDTCATTPDTAIAAINALSSSKQPTANNNLILIAGGADKNLDFKELAQLIVLKIKVLILLEGTATGKLKKTVSQNLKIGNYKLKIINRVDSMKKAVQLAACHAQKGDMILLSPACASFGMFRHEFEKGEAFKKAVKSIK